MKDIEPEHLILGDVDTDLKGWGVGEVTIGAPYQWCPDLYDMTFYWVGERELPFTLLEGFDCVIEESDCEGYDWVGVINRRPSIPLSKRNHFTGYIHSISMRGFCHKGKLRQQNKRGRFGRRSTSCSTILWRTL